MTWIAGVDGCPAGWFRASLDTGSGELIFAIAASAAELLERPPVPALVAIDIPIGLPDRGSRKCDVAARKLLGPGRGSSVFPAPIRPALAASSWEEACKIRKAIDDRKISKQAWAIYPKIREVDALLQVSSQARERIREVHPEVCWWAWAGGVPMRERKKKPAGRAARLELVESWLGRGVAEKARGSHLKKHLADDDVLDACAALWTARRILEGEARTLPETPPRDALGIAMEIVF